MNDHDTWLQVNSIQQAYADATDRADIDGVLALFTPDATWDSDPEHSRVGREDIRKFLIERQSTFLTASHHVGSPNIRVDASTSVLESTTYFMNKHVYKDNSAYTIYGRFADTYAQGPSSLLISYRKIIVHVSEGTSRRYNKLERLPIPAS